MDSRTMLILGGEGFLGLTLMKFFSSWLDCTSIDRTPSPLTSLVKQSHNHFITADPYVTPLSGTYSYIVHLIDQMLSPHQFEVAERLLLQHIPFTAAQHVIIMSSAAVYLRPSSAYAQRKLRLEQLYQEHCALSQQPLTIIRLFNTYGPLQRANRPGGLVATLLLNYLQQKPTIIQDMEARRDFIFSEDIARMMQYILEKRVTGYLDIGTEKLTSIRHLIKHLEAYTLHDHLLISDAGAKETAACPPAHNPLLSKVGFTPLTKGLAQTYRFYQTTDLQLYA